MPARRHRHVVGPRRLSTGPRYSATVMQALVAMRRGAVMSQQRSHRSYTLVYFVGETQLRPKTIESLQEHGLIEPTKHGFRLSDKGTTFTPIR